MDVEHETIEQYLLEGHAFMLAQKLKEGVLKSVVIAGFQIAVRAVFSE